MWKKRMAILSAMILVVGAITAVAVAQDDGGGEGEGKVEIEGRGALWAKGQGNVDLDVKHAKVQMRLDGADVTIVGPAGLDVRINGTRSAMTEGGDTVVVLTDFTGTVGVRGSDFTIDADGTIALRGRGGGTAILSGEGRWRTLHDSGTWDGVERALPA